MGLGAGNLHWRGGCRNEEGWCPHPPGRTGWGASGPCSSCESVQTPSWAPVAITAVCGVHLDGSSGVGIKFRKFLVSWGRSPDLHVTLPGYVCTFSPTAWGPLWLQPVFNLDSPPFSPCLNSCPSCLGNTPGSSLPFLFGFCGPSLPVHPSVLHMLSGRDQVLFSPSARLRPLYFLWPACSGHCTLQHEIK